MAAVNHQELERQFADLAQAMVFAFQHAPQPEGVHVTEESRAQIANVEAVAVLHGWMARVCRTAEAALICCEGGYENESAPLIRSILEHAIAIWWLEDRRGPAFQALVRARSYSMDILRRAQEEGWELDEELQRLLQEAIDIETDEDNRSGDTLLTAARRAAEYDLGSFHQGWLIESWASHPTIMSALPYYTPDLDNNTITLHHEPRFEGRESYAAIASALHTAWVAYDRVLKNANEAKVTEWGARFEELGAQLAAVRKAT